MRYNPTVIGKTYERLLGLTRIPLPEFVRPTDEKIVQAIGPDATRIVDKAKAVIGKAGIVNLSKDYKHSSVQAFSQSEDTKFRVVVETHPPDIMSRSSGIDHPWASFYLVIEKPDGFSFIIDLDNPLRNASENGHRSTLPDETSVEGLKLNFKEFLDSAPDRLAAENHYAKLTSPKNIAPKRFRVIKSLRAIFP